MNNYYSSFDLRFPSGPLNLPRLSETPYLFSMRNTELRLLNPDGTQDGFLLLLYQDTNVLTG